MINSYCESIAVKKLKLRLSTSKPLRIAFLDIDNTITKSIPVQDVAGRERAIFHQLQLRNVLEKKGFVVVFVTARTEEMVMSRREYAFSKESLNRPEPKLKVMQDGRRGIAFASDLQHMPHFSGIVDPDIIAGSTGTRILLRQRTGGYLPDLTYEEGLEDWRAKVMQIVLQLSRSNKYFELALIESKQAYLQGKTDTFPPNLRIQLHLNTPQAIELLERGLYTLKQKYKKNKQMREVLANINIIYDLDGSLSTYTAYLTPKRCGKARAVEHIINKIVTELCSRQANLQEREEMGRNLKVLIAGDSFHDVQMGMYGGLASDASFLVASQSQLANSFRQLKADDRKVTMLNANTQRIRSGLQPSQTEGVFDFSVPMHRKRSVLLGDEVYKNTAGAQTIIHYLEDTIS